MTLTKKALAEGAWCCMLYWFNDIRAHYLSAGLRLLPPPAPAILELVRHVLSQMLRLQRRLQHSLGCA